MPLVCKLYSNLNYLFVSLLTPESWYNFSRSCNRECSDHHQLDAMLVEFSCNKLIKFWMWLYQNLFWKFPTHCVYIIQSQLLKHVTTSQFFVLFVCRFSWALVAILAILGRISGWLVRHGKEPWQSWAACSSCHRKSDIVIPNPNWVPTRTANGGAGDAARPYQRPPLRPAPCAPARPRSQPALRP